MLLKISYGRILKKARKHSTQTLCSKSCDHGRSIQGIKTADNELIMAAFSCYKIKKKLDIKIFT